MRPDRPSLTASLVAAVRALYTEMPAPYRLVSDPVAADLVPAALALPARAVAAAPPAAGAALHHALGLATLGLSFHVALRTRAIDDALLDGVALGATQLVVLGAGLDGRALRLPELAAVRVFEVDHPSTQRYKVERLAARGGAAAARLEARALAHVAVDFERDDLADQLPAAGFSVAERSFWIWEGVTVYLSRDAIAATLRAVAALSPPGSRIALTYVAPDDVARFAWALPLARGLLRGAGEPYRTPLSPDDLVALLDAAGFRLVSDASTPDWAARYWPGQRGVRAVERLAVAERTG